MLRVTLEMIPFGKDSMAREIGTMEIANVGGTGALGDYRVKLKTVKGPQLTTKIVSFQRSRGAWNLVKEALGNMDLNIGA